MSAQNQPGLSLRRVRRWTLFAFVLVLMLALLSACGAVSAPAAPGAAADADSASSAASAEPTKITYMIWADDIANDKNLNAEIQLFNDSHPDVQVELIGVGWNDYTAKLQTLTAAGTPPDVIAIQNEGDFVSKGFLLPLEDLMSEEGFDPNRFLPGANDPAFDGKIYGLRHDTAFWLLFYNKDYFDQAGVAYPPATGYTIDEFMQTACQLSNGEEMQWVVITRPACSSAASWPNSKVLPMSRWMASTARRSTDWMTPTRWRGIKKLPTSSTWRIASPMPIRAAHSAAATPSWPAARPWPSTATGALAMSEPSPPSIGGLRPFRALPSPTSA